MKENITVLRNGGLLIMSEIDMRRLIIAGNAYFGIHDKAGENIDRSLEIIYFLRRRCSLLQFLHSLRHLIDTVTTDINLLMTLSSYFRCVFGDGSAITVRLSLSCQRYFW